MSNHYRPQQSCEGYVFTGICRSTGGEYLMRYTPLGADTTPGLGTPPQARYTPWREQTCPGQGTPPGPGTPLPRTRYNPWNQVHPPEQTPLGPGTPPPWDQVHPPRTRYTPQDQVHPPRYGHSCGWYASYWNAFLLLVIIASFCGHMPPYH